MKPQMDHPVAAMLHTPETARRLGDRYRVEASVAVWHHPDVLLAPASALFREGNQWRTAIYQNGRTVSRTSPTASPPEMNSSSTRPTR